MTINARRIVSMPMTLKDVGSSQPIISLERITDEAVLAEPWKIRTWVSEKPGGDAYSARCDGYSTIARGTTNLVQYASNFACGLPSEGGVFYVNFAITCKFGTVGCTTIGDMYQYGLRYKFFLSRYPG